MITALESVHLTAGDAPDYGTLWSRYPEHELTSVRYAVGMITGATKMYAVLDDTLMHHPTVLRGLASVASQALMMLADVQVLAPTPERGRALRAALVARNAVIDGDDSTVDAFAETWLGIKNPGRWRDAVSMALLGDWVAVLGTGRVGDADLVRLLERDSGTEHRRLLPLWERQVRGRRTALLGEPVGVDQVLADLLTDHRTPEDDALYAELADSRLLAVLRGLTEDETKAALAWAAGAESWALAAIEAGMPKAFGERVRRKLKRLGDRHTQRSMAMTPARRLSCL